MLLRVKIFKFELAKVRELMDRAFQLTYIEEG